MSRGALRVPLPMLSIAFILLGCTEESRDPLQPGTPNLATERYVGDDQGGDGDAFCDRGSCFGDYGDGGGGGAGGGSGGGAGEGTADTPTGQPIANDEETSCHLADSGNCDLRPATEAEIALARAEADRVRPDGICGDIRSMAHQMISNGLSVWTNQVTQDGLVLLGDFGWEFSGPTGTDRVPVMHLWLSGGMNAWTIAHEALHGMGYYHDNTLAGPDGVVRTMDGTARFCSGS